MVFQVGVGTLKKGEKNPITISRFNASVFNLMGQLGVPFQLGSPCNFMWIIVLQKHRKVLIFQQIEQLLIWWVSNDDSCH